MGYSFWLATREPLYALSHWQDSTYHSLYYTTCGAQAEKISRSMDPPDGIDLTIPSWYRMLLSYSNADKAGRQTWTDHQNACVRPTNRAPPRSDTRCRWTTSSTPVGHTTSAYCRTSYQALSPSSRPNDRSDCDWLWRRRCEAGQQFCMEVGGTVLEL